MKPTKTYLHDRFVLLLVSASLFFVALTIILVSWQLGSVRNEGYIVQYRPSLGLDAFRKGPVSELIAFPIFAVVAFLINLLLSIKTYKIHRYFSRAILALGLLLSILAMIISYSLLRLS